MENSPKIRAKLSTCKPQLSTSKHSYPNAPSTSQPSAMCASKFPPLSVTGDLDCITRSGICRPEVGASSRMGYAPSGALVLRSPICNIHGACKPG